jgi:hypothetical protein
MNLEDVVYPRPRPVRRYTKKWLESKDERALGESVLEESALEESSLSESALQECFGQKHFAGKNFGLPPLKEAAAVPSIINWHKPQKEQHIKEHYCSCTTTRNILY